MRKTAQFTGLIDAVEKEASFLPAAAAALSPILGANLSDPYVSLAQSLDAEDPSETDITRKLFNDAEVQKIKNLRIEPHPEVKGNAFFDTLEEEGKEPILRLIFGKKEHEEGKPDGWMWENAGTTAHELGHAIDYSRNGKLHTPLSNALHYIGGWGLVPAGYTLAMAAAGKDLTPGEAAIAGLIGSALDYNRIRNEVVASEYGYDLLRRAGKNPWEAFTSSYRGVPSYILSTLGANLAPAAVLALISAFADKGNG